MAAIMPYVAFCALVYLLQSALLRQPSEPIRSYARRAHAPWSREEVELFQALLEHGVAKDDIASLLQRTPKSLEYEQQRERLPSEMPYYPQTTQQLCQDDLTLLKVAVTAGPDKLHWRFAECLPSMYTEAASTPTLRVIEVSPDPLAARVRRRGMNDWASQRNDADMAVQGVWADIALELILHKHAVLIPPPDPHSRRRTALRAMLRRMAGDVPIPRGTVVLGGEPSRADRVLLDQPQQWDRAAVSRLKAPLVIAVLPALERPRLSENDPRTPSPPLPHLLRGQVEHADPWIEAAKSEWYTREAWLTSVKTGRTVEIYEHEGFSNGAGQSIRVDWPVLRWLPPRGTLLVESKSALVQSAVWYAALTGTKLDVDASTWDGLLPEPMTPAEWHDTRAKEITDRNERLRQRMLLDLRHWPEEKSELEVRLVEALGVDP